MIGDLVALFTVPLKPSLQAFNGALTLPPASAILFCSAGFVGLWSRVSRRAVPFLTTNAPLSPTCATNSSYIALPLHGNMLPLHPPRRDRKHEHDEQL